MKYIEARFGQSFATKEIWKTINPVLLSGEIGVESDTNLFKIGDGATHWNDLPYELSAAKAFTPILDQENNLNGIIINCGGAAEVAKRLNK